MKTAVRPVSWIIAVLAALPAGGAVGAAFVFPTALMAAAAGPTAADSSAAARTAAQIAKAKPSPPPCLLAQGEPIPAQKIMQDLALGRIVDLQGRIIDGSLDADVAGVASDEHRTSLRILPGRLRLVACRVNGAQIDAVAARRIAIHHHRRDRHVVDESGGFPVEYSSNSAGSCR